MGESTDKHKLAYLSVDKIVPTAWNVNEEDEKTFDMLVDEISETGFIAPITVIPLEDGTYCSLGGEHRWRAAKAAGQEEIPCLILQGAKWKEKDLQKLVSVRMNMIKGKMNSQKFATLYQEMAEKYGKEQLQKLFGFVDKKAFDKMSKGIVTAAKRSLPKELHADLDEKAKDAKTAEDLGKIVQEMFSKYGDTMAQSYMILTHGKQEHIYIRMNASMRKAVDKVMTYCDVTGTDINAFMEPVLKACLKEAMEKLDDGAKGKEKSGGTSDPF